MIIAPASRPSRWWSRKLLPGGKIFGRDYIARELRAAPTAGRVRSRSSFSGRMRGPGRISGTGERGGDPVSLVAYLERIRKADVARLLAGMLGIAP